MSVRDKRVGFVGGGNMGEALVRGLTKTGLMPVGHLLMADVRADRLEELKRLYGIVVIPDNVTLVRRADVVILAVKPQILGEVLDEIAPATPGKLLISVAAGVSTSEIRRHLPPGTRMIRVMPNTPALVLEGATAIARAAGLEEGDLDTARQIFEAVGRVVILDEEMMDAVTGLSGSGPAYIALVVEALADGGVRVGPGSQDGDDAGHADGARLGAAPDRHRHAPRPAQGHGQLPRRDHDHRHPHAGVRGAPADPDRRGGAGDPAVARAGPGAVGDAVYVLGDFLLAVAKLVDYVLYAYMWIIVIRALLSWVNPDPWNPIVRFLHQVTEPVLRPIRRRLPYSSIDFSPLVVILGIYFLQWFLVPVLVRTAYRLG